MRELLPGLRERLGISLVIANGENVAGGSGITIATAQELFAAGIDILTSGDHIWDQKEIMDFIETEPRLLRPLNYPEGAPGRGSALWQKAGFPPVVVINLQGRTFMPPLENPFAAILRELARVRSQASIVFVDFHAEATSEKVALARLLDGRVSAVVGTHTHVQTADERVLPGGTAFLCDAGFTGPHDSVIGREIEPVLKRFTTNLPQRFGVASGNIRLQGAVVEVDPVSGRAIGIQRISEPVPASGLGGAND